MEDAKKTVLSCIQPTGEMHFGNYFGAVQNWVKLQESHRCLYGVVDYHAMTMPYKPKKLRENVWNLIFNLIAVGVKTENLFIQSLIPEHAELCWIFNCYCPFGNLSRMTQFKDKSQQGSEGFISAGLFDYPVLQSADILIYNADYVPVGKDQDQHLELSRVIAQRFNNGVGKEYFVLPQTLHTETPKIMSTADPMRKMSKSAGEKHYIGVFSDEERIRKQIKSAVTDTGESSEGEMSPGIENLFRLIRASGNNTEGYDSLLNDFNSGNLKYVDLKDVAADSLVALSQSFTERRGTLLDNKKDVKNHVKESAAEIRKIAQATLRDVKELSGLLNVKY